MHAVPGFVDQPGDRGKGHLLGQGQHQRLKQQCEARELAKPLGLDLGDPPVGQLDPRGSDLEVAFVLEEVEVPQPTFDQLYSFDVDSLIGAIPRTEKVTAERFNAMAEEVFNRVMQIGDNAGATDEHRALNYLAVRYPALYAAVAEAQARNASLSAVDVRPSPVSETRQIVDVIFSFADRATDVVDKRSVRVDVTEKFPFLVTRLSPYYDIR